MDITTLIMIVFGCMLGGFALAGALWLVVSIRQLGVQKTLSESVRFPDNANSEQLLLTIVNRTALTVTIREVNLKTKQGAIIQLKPALPDQPEPMPYLSPPDSDEKIWNLANHVCAISTCDFVELPQQCGAYWGLDPLDIRDPNWAFSEIELIAEYPIVFGGQRLATVNSGTDQVQRLQNYFAQHIEFVNKKEKYDMSKEFDLEKH